MALVYALAEPDTKEVRYIGYTNNLEKRLLEHYNDALRPVTYSIRLEVAGRKAAWLRQLLASKQTPAVILLCICEVHEKAFYEAFWLEVYESANLLNIAKARRNYLPSN